MLKLLRRASAYEASFDCGAELKEDDDDDEEEEEEEEEDSPAILRICTFST